jgi:prevent-host-death family protein
MKVSVYEAKSKLSQMINKALEGEEVVITRNGKDVVRLAPVQKKKRDWIGMWEGQIKINDDFDSLDDETMRYFTGEAETFLDKVLREEREKETGEDA